MGAKQLNIVISFRGVQKFCTETTVISTRSETQTSDIHLLGHKLIKISCNATRVTPVNLKRMPS